MAVTIIVKGGSFDLHESEKFDKVRHRLNEAKRTVIDYTEGNIDGKTKGNANKGERDQRFRPFHTLSFKCVIPENEDDPDTEYIIGRIAVDVDDVIGIMADTEKDVTGGFGSNGAEDEEEEEGEE